MSVQLVLFPQTHFRQQLLVDGLDFVGVPSASNYDTAVTGVIFVDIMANAAPTAPNTWFKFRALGTNTSYPAVATSSGGILSLNSITGGAAFCGVYQQLSGLIIGEEYRVSIEWLAGSVGSVAISHYVGGIGSTSFPQDVSTSTAYSYVFTASAINETIFISYWNNTNDDLEITMAKCEPVTPLSYEGQVICDLYEDEEIPLTLSVDNFKNVAEKIQSYSKDFNLPGTKRNNKIFGNIFDITRTFDNPYDFNPYLKSRAVLKEDGFIIFDGFIRLIDIQERDGERSYNVNLYAQTTALADTLKNRTFDYIDFSELEHNYDKVAIKGSWYASGLPLNNPLPVGTYAGTAGASVTDVLKYPFVDWTGGILYANGSTGSGATLGTPELTNLEQGFRPFIKVKYLVDRIFSEAGYTYSSSIFDSTEFKDLFMDFNWGGDKMPSVMDETLYNANTGSYAPTGVVIGTSFESIPLYPDGTTYGDSTSQVPPDYVSTSGATYEFYIVSTEDNVLYNIFCKFGFAGSNTGNNLRWAWEFYDDSAGTTTYINDNTVGVQNVSAGVGYVQSTVNVTLDTDDRLRPVMMKESGTGNVLFYGGAANFTVSSATVKSATLNALRGEINQWDFLKGLFTMFNLVTLKDETDANNIIIEPYADIFITTTKGTTLEERSIQHDWTDKVDIKDITLNPLNDLKKTTVFKYEEDDGDYVFNLYKDATRGHLYGSKVFSAEGLTILEGEDEIVASPFAATVSKPIWEGLPNWIIPAIYSVAEDGTPSGFDNLPRILYQMNASPTTMATTFFIPGQNGQSSENSSLLYTFSHLTDIPTTTGTSDFNFGECQLIPPIGQAVPDNLFNNYWFPYYNQLYNPDTRTMEIKVNLQPGDIATFKFSDYVMIKNRTYRVNRIDYKPGDLSTVEFILMN